jgi:ATP-binding cassette, subfamily B, bacterial
MKNKINNTMMISFLWKSIKPYKFYLLLILQAPIIGAMTVPISQYAIKLLIDTISLNPVFTTYDLILPIILLIGSHIILELVWRIADVTEYYSIPFIKTNVTLEAYSYITSHSYTFFQENLAGTISAKINNIESTLGNIFNILKLHIIHPISMIIVSLFFLYQVSSVFVPVILIFYLIFFPTVYFLSKKISYFSANYTHNKQKTSGLVTDSISNIISMLLFSNSTQEKKSIRSSLNNLLTSEQRMLKYEFFLNCFIGIIYISLSAIILFLLIDLKREGKITIGDFALVLGLLTHMLQVAYILVVNVKELVKNSGELKESFNIFNTEYETKDLASSKKLILNESTIEFQNVNFSYNDSAQIFENLNFNIHSGEKVGIVGHSGSGKSTLISILLKYFDIQSGAILIDDQNISNVTKDSLRQNITVIPQDTPLFHRSIKENILYGKFNASDAEVVVASKQAHIHDIITKLPLKYDTLVGERGIKLSGGQRQRVAIARAILKNSPILILDEATSSLDSETENYIQESLDTLIKDKNKTVIAIAHRLSTLKHMDRIIVLNKGKIVESGSHDELMSNNKSLYRKLWKLQKI